MTLTRKESASFIAASLRLVMEARTISYRRLLCQLADEFGGDNIAARTLEAYTVLVKAGVVLSSTPPFRGEPAIGDDTALAVCGVLQAVLEAKLTEPV
jgi:hypothetical protein